jgi:hypothetical protein
MVRETRFLPDMNRAREYGWTEEGNPSSFLSTEALAESIVGRFIDLSERAERGEFIRPETPSSPRRGRRR